ASVAIGALLGVLALIMLIETHGLLIGEAASPELVRAVCDTAARDEVVTGVDQVLTVHTGPEEVVLVLRLRVRPGLSAEDVAKRFAELEERLRAEHGELRRVFFEVVADAERAS